MIKAGKVFGPFSKYDTTLPYTYSASVYAIENNKDIVSYYFSDTICGLIETLDEQKISPQNVDLTGHYLGKDIPLQKKYCLSHDGDWLKRPDICHSLEEHYKDYSGRTL